MSLLLRQPNGRWKVWGIEQPLGIELARNDVCLVLRIPGFKYWAQIGVQAYAAAEQQVYLITGVTRDDRISADKLIDFRTSKKPIKRPALIGRSVRSKDE